MGWPTWSVWVVALIAAGVCQDLTGNVDAADQTYAKNVMVSGPASSVVFRGCTFSHGLTIISTSLSSDATLRVIVTSCTIATGFTVTLSDESFAAIEITVSDTTANAAQVAVPTASPVRVTARLEGFTAGGLRFGQIAAAPGSVIALERSSIGAELIVLGGSYSGATVLVRHCTLGGNPSGTSPVVRLATLPTTLVNTTVALVDNVIPGFAAARTAVDAVASLIELTRSSLTLRNMTGGDGSGFLTLEGALALLDHARLVVTLADTRATGVLAAVAPTIRGANVTLELTMRGCAGDSITVAPKVVDGGVGTFLVDIADTNIPNTARFTTSGVATKHVTWEVRAVGLGGGGLVVLEHTTIERGSVFTLARSAMSGVILRQLTMVQGAEFHIVNNTFVEGQKHSVWFHTVAMQRDAAVVVAGNTFANNTRPGGSAVSVELLNMDGASLTVVDNAVAPEARMAAIFMSFANVDAASSTVRIVRNAVGSAAFEVLRAQLFVNDSDVVIEADGATAVGANFPIAIDLGARAASVAPSRARVVLRRMTLSGMTITGSDACWFSRIELEDIAARVANLKALRVNQGGTVAVVRGLYSALSLTDLHAIGSSTVTLRDATIERQSSARSGLTLGDVLVRRSTLRVANCSVTGFVEALVLAGVTAEDSVIELTDTALQSDALNHMGVRTEVAAPVALHTSRLRVSNLFVNVTSGMALQLYATANQSSVTFYVASGSAGRALMYFTEVNDGDALPLSTVGVVLDGVEFKELEVVGRAASTSVPRLFAFKLLRSTVPSVLVSAWVIDGVDVAVEDSHIAAGLSFDQFTQRGASGVLVAPTATSSPHWRVVVRGCTFPENKAFKRDRLVLGNWVAAGGAVLIANNAVTPPLKASNDGVGIKMHTLECTACTVCITNNTIHSMQYAASIELASSARFTNSDLHVSAGGAAGGRRGVVWRAAHANVTALLLVEGANMEGGLDLAPQDVSRSFISVGDAAPSPGMVVVVRQSIILGEITLSSGADGWPSAMRHVHVADTTFTELAVATYRGWATINVTQCRGTHMAVSDATLGGFFHVERTVVVSRRLTESVNFFRANIHAPVAFVDCQVSPTAAVTKAGFYLDGTVVINATTFTVQNVTFPHNPSITSGLATLLVRAVVVDSHVALVGIAFGNAKGLEVRTVATSVNATFTVVCEHNPAASVISVALAAAPHDNYLRLRVADGTIGALTVSGGRIEAFAMVRMSLESVRFSATTALEPAARCVFEDAVASGVLQLDAATTGGNVSLERVAAAGVVIAPQHLRQAFYILRDVRLASSTLGVLLLISTATVSDTVIFVQRLFASAAKDVTVRLSLTDSAVVYILDSVLDGGYMGIHQPVAAQSLTIVNTSVLGSQFVHLGAPLHATLLNLVLPSAVISWQHGATALPTGVTWRRTAGCFVDAAAPDTDATVRLLGAQAAEFQVTTACTRPTVPDPPPQGSVSLAIPATPQPLWDDALVVEAACDFDAPLGHADAAPRSPTATPTVGPTSIQARSVTATLVAAATRVPQDGGDTDVPQRPPAVTRTVVAGEPPTGRVPVATPPYQPSSASATASPTLVQQRSGLAQSLSLSTSSNATALAMGAAAAGSGASASAFERTAATAAVLGLAASALATNSAAGADAQSLLVLGSWSCSGRQANNVAAVGARGVVPLRLGNSALAGVYGSLAIVAGVAALQQLVAMGLLASGRARRKAAAWGTVRFPSVTFSATGLLYQGIVVEAAQALAAPARSGAFAVVVAGAVLVVCVAAALAPLLVRANPGKFPVTFLPFTALHARFPLLAAMALPTGFWRDVERGSRVYARYGGLVGAMRGPAPAAAWLLVPGRRLAVAVATAAAKSSPAWCKALLGIVAGAHVAAAIAAVALQPFRVRLNVSGAALIDLMTAVAVASAVADVGEAVFPSLVIAVTAIGATLGVAILAIKLVERKRWRKQELAASGPPPPAAAAGPDTTAEPLLQQPVLAAPGPSPDGEAVANPLEGASTPTAAAPPHPNTAGR